MIARPALHFFPTGYVVYVAYRLEPPSTISHSLRLSKVNRSSKEGGEASANGTQQQPATIQEAEEGEEGSSNEV